MLDQMVESKDTMKESRTLLALFSFLIVLAIVSVIGVGVWHLSSLFGYFQGGGMGGDLELTSLVAPVAVEAEEPPPVEEKVEKVEQVKQNVDVRQVIMQDVANNTKIPDTTSVVVNKTKTVRDIGNTVLGKTDSDAEVLRSSDREAVSLNQEGATSQPDKILVDDGDEPKLERTPTPKPEPTATPKPQPKTISGGVVNGKARNLVQPTYPAAARATRAAGQVQVSIKIDESGRVVSASAISGNPLLRSAAVSAAQRSTFNPTLLSGQPVSVTGIIIYNFVP